MMSVVDPYPDVEERGRMTDGINHIGYSHWDTQMDEYQWVRCENEDDGNGLRR